MDLNRIEVIVSWQTPTCLKKIQAFVGFSSFYRRFIKNFAKTVKSLVFLTQKKYPFFWSEACHEAFHRLKVMATNALVLRHYDRVRITVFETDSLSYVNRRVLSQADNNRVLYLIAFYSKNLLLAKSNDKIYDKEVLAIV